MERLEGLLSVKVDIALEIKTKNKLDVLVRTK